VDTYFPEEHIAFMTRSYIVTTEEASFEKRWLLIYQTTQHHILKSKVFPVQAMEALRVARG
jgi:hypothetical protein